MGNGGSKGGGGGGSGSKGNSICGIDRRDIRSITHEYHDRPFNKNKDWGSSCIKGHRDTKWDCSVEHYRDSYPSGHSNSSGGEGRSGSGNSTSSSVSNGSGSNTSSTGNESNSSVVVSSIPPRESYIANPHAPHHVKALESYLLTKYGGLDALSKGIILGSNSVHRRFQLDALIDGQKPPSESWAMKNMVAQLTGMSLSVKGREETVPSVVKVITLCDNNICDYDLLKLQTSCFVYRSKLNLDGLYLHHNQITDVGVKYLLNAYIPDSGLKITQPLLDRIVQENIKGFINTPGYRNVREINLSNNQIGDEGAKLLADSLAKGEMPNLKKLHLEGNKITSEGHGFLSKALEVVEQNINVVLKSIQNASKSAAQFAIKEMLHIAKSNGISTQEVLTNQETIEYCKKGILNVVGNLGLGYFKCWTKLDKPIAVYEMDFQYVATALMVNIINPAKKTVQVYCTIESTVFSVVDEDFANCLTGLDSELNND